jgi:hypothetical protein
MSKKRGLSTLVLLIVISSILLSYSLVAALRNALPEGRPVLWREPEDIASRDLYHGPGGEAMKPDLSKVTFVENKIIGYSTKYRVRDGSGNEWVVKVGEEAQSDTVAGRLLWAVGYQAEISYFVPSVNIEGIGAVENARFEARPKDIKRASTWSWDDNPFEGTREFQGLKVMMALINNWDIKDENNKTLVVRNRVTGETELHYIISDLGGSFGRAGNMVTRSRNNPTDYVNSEFVEGVIGNHVAFSYSGKRRGLFHQITVEQAAWIGGWLSRLSEQQIRDAFRSGNYNPEEVEMLSMGLIERIKELNALAGERLAPKEEV